MAKILVADDNSNIQKMVGLALKDQGIDVVAVGNGEAAVRKISDVRPDLVLADVFMPVRNGYEVCNYVKQDSALAHIPVILLVGAFDPLDEQEAQRVGADGVLKKPFVPPDPLISMVKSALTRAGVVLGAPDSPAPRQPESGAKPEPPSLPRVAPPPPPLSEPEPDPGLTSFSSRPAPLAIDKGSRPLAFGNLLDTPAQEEVAALANSNTTAALDHDWGKNEAEGEDEVAEEETKTDSWRVSSMDEIPNEAPAGQTDWREAAFSGIESGKSFQEWAPSVEKNGFPIAEEEAAELAKTPEPAEMPRATSGSEDWSKAIDSIFPEKPAVEQEPQKTYTPAQSADPAPAVEPQPAAQSSELVVSEPAPVAAAPVEAPAAEPASVLNSWMAGAVSPWEAELQRANELASTWDGAKVAPAVVEDTRVTEAFLDSGLMATAHEQVVETIQEVKTEEALDRSAPEPSTTATESLSSPPEHPVEPELPAASESSEAPALAPEAVDREEPVAPAPAPDSNHMDELVAKVLAKMNPEVLQAVTREILKPVIEALVKDELNKK